MGLPWRRTTPGAAEPEAETGDALVARIADWLPELETPLAWEAVEPAPFPVHGLDERPHSSADVASRSRLPLTGSSSG